MSARYGKLPEGWSFEPDDPSVGIFGSYFWHCSDDDDKYDDEIEATQELVQRDANTQTGEVKLTVLLTCRICGATGRVMEYDFDPEILA